MSQYQSLLWKEWREARPFLLIGLGLFLVLPLVGGAEDVLAHPGHRFSLATANWVVALGGVLAVFVAVGVTTPDLRPKVADFWRSRPVSVGAWMATKYAVALAVVLVACAVPLVLEMTLGFRPDPADRAYLAFLPFFWTAAFSLAFLAACLVDRPAHAAVLGLAALLVVYVLPVVVPPLAWLNVAEISVAFGKYRFGPRQAVFAGGMLVLSATAVTVAVVGVRRGWRVESGRKLLYGLVATAVLLLFASAAFQLGSNLPVLAGAQLPADERVSYIAEGDPAGTYIVCSTGAWSPPQYVPNQEPPPNYYRYRTLRVDRAGMTLGPMMSGHERGERVALSPWVPRRDGFAYFVDGEKTPGHAGQTDVTLNVADARNGDPVRSILLWQAEEGTDAGSADLLYWADKLYVVGRERLRTYDLATPGQPRLVSDEPFRVRDWWRPPFISDQQVRETLIPLPGVPPVGRMRATMRYGDLDGDTLCLPPNDKDGHELVAYHLSNLTDRTATFDRIGAFHPSVLQRLVGGLDRPRVQVVDGLAYLQGNTSGSFNAAITVLDTRGDRPMREVGHFAAPEAYMYLPLPDGRMLVSGGNRVRLVGAPARR